jgi:hypothetical protein
VVRAPKRVQAPKEATMNRIVLMSLVALAVAIPTLAIGKPPPPQTHECVKDGAVLQKTKKECAKAGGTWAKMKPAAAAPAATTDAGTP